MSGVQDIGVDIVDVDRIRVSYERYGDRFLFKILTEEEIASCRKKGDMIQSVAARFAAKEALSKALGCGISKKFSWHSVEILNALNGKPYVRVVDNSSTLKNASNKISLTHDKRYAASVAMISFP